MASQSLPIESNDLFNSGMTRPVIACLSILLIDHVYFCVYVNLFLFSKVIVMGLYPACETFVVF